jgi:hypothetical protein
MNDGDLGVTVSRLVVLILALRTACARGLMFQVARLWLLSTGAAWKMTVNNCCLGQQKVVEETLIDGEFRSKEYHTSGLYLEFW